MKVRTSPNSKFANISNIQRAQIAARDVQNREEDRKEGNESDSILDYILIKQLINVVYYRTDYITEPITFPWHRTLNTNKLTTTK